MKHAISAGLTLTLTVLLSACPSTQTPVTNIAGTWHGEAGEIDQPSSKLPLTVTFEQEGAALTGTAIHGPPEYKTSGDLTGRVEGDTAIFSFSAPLDPPDTGSEATIIITYSFTGAISGDMMGDELTVTNNVSDLTVPLEFKLERQ